MTSQELVHGRPRRPDDVTIDNAQIFFKNFRGEVGTYNEKGLRTFACALPEDIAAQMIKDGWNIKQTKVRDEGDVPTFFVPVEVSFRVRPPRVVMIGEAWNAITERFEQVRTQIPEELVGMLDYADMAQVDLMINPYPYNYNGRTGIKAYLKAIYVTVRMDRLERKYAPIREVDINGAPLELTQAGEEPTEEDIILGEVIYDER